MRKYFIKILILCCAVLGLEGCQPESGGMSQDTTLGVKVYTYAEAGLTYPVAVFVFGENGELLESKKASVPSQILYFQLKTLENYHVVAVAENEDFDIPENPTLYSVITPRYGQAHEAIAQNPLMMGMATFTIHDVMTTLSLALTPQTANMEISLRDVPDAVSSLEVSLGYLYSGVAMCGRGSGAETVSISLRREGDVWKSVPVWVLPSVDNQFRFTVVSEGAEGENIFGITCPNPLLSAQYYQLCGSYTHLESLIQSDTIVIPIDEDSSGVWVEEFPVAGEVWQGHVVVMVDSIAPGKAEVMLMSLWDWGNLPSANNADNPEYALSLAENYIEGEIESWRIPSKAEAQRLKSLYNEQNMAELNQVFRSLNAAELLIEDGGETARYLCENGTKTFSFRSGTTISNAGSVRSDYRMRLVHVVTMKKTSRE